MPRGAAAGRCRSAAPQAWLPLLLQLAWQRRLGLHPVQPWAVAAAICTAPVGALLGNTVTAAQTEHTPLLTATLPAPCRTGTYFCMDLSVTAVVIKGLAEHKDELGAPLCPCRHYDDKAAEAEQGYWNCPCVPMRERKVGVGAAAASAVCWAVLGSNQVQGEGCGCCPAGRGWIAKAQPQR